MCAIEPGTLQDRCSWRLSPAAPLRRGDRSAWRRACLRGRPTAIAWYLAVTVANGKSRSLRPTVCTSYRERQDQLRSSALPWIATSTTRDSLGPDCGTAATRSSCRGGPATTSTCFESISMVGSCRSPRGQDWSTGRWCRLPANLIFTRTDVTPSVWSLPLAPSGEPPRREAAPARMFGASRDGSKVVFGRMLGAVRGELVLRDRAKGTDTVLASHEVDDGGTGSFFAHVSPDGTQVAYRANVGGFAGTYIVSTEGGATRLLKGSKTFDLGQRLVPRQPESDRRMPSDDRWGSARSTRPPTRLVSC